MRMDSDPDNALNGWHRWIEMLDDHPLDEIEYSQLLAHRAKIAEVLEVADSEDGWANPRRTRPAVLRPHGRFPDQPFPDRPEPWARPLPIDEEDRLYIAKDFGETARHE